MIFPWLDGLSRWKQAPITWLIFLINLVCFSWSNPLTQLAQHQLEEIMSKPAFVAIQGQVFAAFIFKDIVPYPKAYHDLANKAVLSGSVEQLRHLGELATHDRLFLKYAPRLNLIPDPVAQNYWRTHAVEFLQILESDPLTRFGLSHHNSTEAIYQQVTWVTYQFFHGSGGHLLSNMALFFIFGCWLEKRFGSLGFFFFYLTAGIISGACFQAFTGVSSLPLIGASGSISGMMGAVIALHFISPLTTRMKFVYLLLPLPSYMGLLFLPAWVAFFFWLIPDVAGWISTPAEFAGVAHVAHIGGLIFGLALGTFMGVEYNQRSESDLARTQVVPAFI